MDIASISAIVAATGVIVGVVFAILELRNFVKTRQTDLVMRLYSIWGSRETLEAWATFQEKPEDSLVEENIVGIFFEGIGVLLHRKLIDIDLVSDLLGSQIKITWEIMKPSIERVRRDQPTVWEWFEYLYNEMKKREQTLQAQQ